MIERLKKYLLDYNRKALAEKISGGTGTREDIASYERMADYTRHGRW